METPPWTPGRILATAGAYWQPCTLMAAVKLDVFTHLGKERLTAGEVATRIGSQPRSMATILNALTAMGLLEKSGEHYKNTGAASSYLCKGASEYMGHMVQHHSDLIPSWSRLTAAVLSQRPVPNHQLLPADTTREHFLMGMYNMASNLAPEVVSHVDLSGQRHLLDLGGGPGTWAIYFCRQYPKLAATVCDLPSTRPFAEKTIARFGLTERIDFKDCDYLSQKIPGSYDAAWLSHILHAEPPEDCAAIIKKTVSALEPGGMLMVHDFILDNDMAGPLFPALFSLNMLLRTESGRSYCQRDIEEMLSAVGADHLHRLHLETPNNSDVILGTVSEK